MRIHRQASSTRREDWKTDRRRRFRPAGRRQAPLAMRQHRGANPSLPANRMRLNEIAAGTIDISGDTIFPEAAETLTAHTRPLISDAVIKVGEFEKAIFKLPGRDDVLAVRSLDTLRQFKAVTVKFWAIDVKTGCRGNQV
ncbi:MAG: hypothetical protein ISR47_00055 [Rhodospirillales bacterium]|nr:hypothetical protein [Rhodospirillales bacterium]